MSANNVVLEALKNSEQPLKTGELVEITSLEKKDVDKAIKALKAEGAIISPKRCYYSVEK